MKVDKKYHQLVDYMQSLTITQGQGVGEHMELMEWQHEVCLAVCREDISTIAVSMPRGLGKSTFFGGLACACINGPLAERRGQVVAVAGSFDQARIIYHAALAFLEEEFPDIRVDKKNWQVSDTETRAELTCKINRQNIEFKARACNARTAHGIAPKLMLMDEPAQWPDNMANRLVAALRTSLGKIPGSKAAGLGTRPDGRGALVPKVARRGRPL